MQQQEPEQEQEQQPSKVTYPVITKLLSEFLLGGAAIEYQGERYITRNSYFQLDMTPQTSRNHKGPSFRIQDPSPPKAEP